MKCPNDEAEMEEGYFVEAHWVSGVKPRLGGIMALGRTTKFVTAYRCEKCGKLEFYTQPGN